MNDNCTDDNFASSYYDYLLHQPTSYAQLQLQSQQFGNDFDSFEILNLEDFQTTSLFGTIQWSTSVDINTTSNTVNLADITTSPTSIGQLFIDETSKTALTDSSSFVSAQQTTSSSSSSSSSVANSPISSTTTATTTSSTPPPQQNNHVSNSVDVQM